MIIHPLRLRVQLLAAALLLGLVGCGNATTKPVPPKTITLRFDLQGPPGATTLDTVVAVLDGARPQRDTLTVAADGHFHGATFATARLPLTVRFLRLPHAAAELDSFWAPVPEHPVTPGDSDTTLAFTVAHWDHPPDPANPDVTFLVTVPATTPPNDGVWISGNQPQIGNWGSGNGLRLTRRPDGRFMTRVRFPAASGLEYKFTRGSWDTVEKDATGNELPNRTFSVAASDTIEALVATWRDQTGGGGGGQLTGTIRYHRGVTSRFLTPTRDVIVYLPPQYDAQAPRRYPVLYLHDGQNTMDASTSFAGEWHADETAERLITAGEIEPLIIVGVYNTSDRIGEYTPVRDSQNRGGNGDNYGRFLVEELKPLIDSTYRTKLDAASTGVAGSSLGGLISMHFALTHAETFGKAGVISPSVWWADGAIVEEVNARPKSAVRIWEDIGTAEGGGSATETVDGARSLRDALIARGWVLGQDLRYLEVAGAAHNEGAWSARFDQVLKFLYPATP